MSITPYNETDLKQGGYTLLQIDATVIMGALIFLTISSLTNISPTEELSVRWYVSIITTVVIVPFVVSASYAIVAVYAWGGVPGRRYRYIHHSFQSTLIGFIYVPGFIIVVALVVNYIHVTTLQGAVQGIFILAAIAGVAIAVAIAVFTRRSGAEPPIPSTVMDLNIDPEQWKKVLRASKKRGISADDFVNQALGRKLRIRG
jgi:hypothetical protein